MEPEERLTKRERRERARRERKEQEQARQRQGSQRRLLTIAGTIVALVGIAALIWFTRPEPGTTGITVAAGEIEEAVLSAGCERQDIGALPDDLVAPHIPEEGAPDPEELYPGHPTHHGPHFATTNPVGVFDEPVDERRTTHNLEHGAIVVWYDPDVISDADLAALEGWAADRNRAGFQQRAGTGLIVSPYFRGLDSGGALALRGWFAAVDCDGFDETAADAFLALHYGDRGLGPEARAFAPYPDDVLDLDGSIDEDPFGGGELEGEEPADEDEPAEPEGSADDDAADDTDDEDA